MTFSKSIIFKSLALICPLAIASYASTIIPTSVTASDNNASAINLINGSGLSHPGSTGTADYWYNHMWMAFDPTATLTFNLGAEYNLTNAFVWNYNGENFDAGVQTMTILVSSDDVNFTSVGNYTLTEGDNSFALPVNNLTLPTGTTAQFVKFSLTENYCDPNNIGLSEVEFAGTLAPEPCTAGLAALAAAGALALLIKRRSA